MVDNRAAEINGDEDQDEAVRIAIALSLGQRPTKAPDGPNTHRVIDLTQEKDGCSDDGEGDGHGHCSESRPAVAPNRTNVPASAKSEDASTSLPSLSILGLDRKKMEEERLARLNKRKAAEPADIPGSRPAQRPRTAALQSPLTSNATSGEKIVLAKSEAGGSSTVARSSDLPFPRGVVKKTWAFGQPRQGDDIRIEEVLQKDQLKLAVLSSYQWDEEWLLSKIDLARTKLVLIAFAADEAQKEEMRSNVPRDRIRFCFPPMQTMGSMHSKLQLLKYEKYMRIVVPTGNLMSYDWGETGTMENMVFIIDLPKFETAEERDAQKLTPFGEELCYFLLAQGMDEKLVSSLGNYDFSETNRYGFVHTIAGSHISEDAWRRTGYCGLGQAVSALGVGSSSPIEMDYVCASLGAVNESLLRGLYYACQAGDCGLKEYDARTAGRKSKDANLADHAVVPVLDHMRVYFPSRETIMRSKGGKANAGTICFQAKWWQAETFPHKVLRDCKSVRSGLVMHSKIIYVRRKGEGLSKPGGFAYIGSANLSESAWGRLVKDRGSGKPKLTCRNWECGVLVQACRTGSTQGQRDAHLGDERDADVTDLAVFRDCVPVVMEWPSTGFSLGPDAAKSPWFYQDG
ncbi:phospholipase D/nuclease [Canariomyces notabilis]|uniref:Phospholipase D/nuclease n=1 Tax=Canariomyces notabilis TaxID=2074819 RepID=A0AAN6THS6_9PEZI|nr:phospholipase D/nuclease [Canariomyces arenarius]